MLATCGIVKRTSTRGAGGAGELAVQLLHTTDWGHLDDLIIDTPPGTGSDSPRIGGAGALRGVRGRRDAVRARGRGRRKGVSMLRKFDVPILGVVEGCVEINQCVGCGSMTWRTTR